MDWVAWLRPLWDIVLSWFRGVTGPRPPSVATGGSVVSNRNITIKKAKNLNAAIKTESNGPSEKENDAGQGPQTRKTACGASVINEDKVCVDEVEGDVDLSVSTKKGN